MINENSRCIDAKSVAPGALAASGNQPSVYLTT
jgi:hypothetical protein